MTILESKPIALSNLVAFERTGMFDSPISLNVLRTFTASNHEIKVRIAPNHLSSIKQFSRCDMSNPLVRVGLLPPDKDAMCVSREEVVSPNLPGFVLFSETLEDLVMILAPARPEGCPFECWFPLLDYGIGFTDDNIMPVLVHDDFNVYTYIYGSKFKISTEGTFPTSGKPAKTIIANRCYASWYGVEQSRHYAVRGKRLWVFHPIDRTLIRVQTPIYDIPGDLASMFGIYFSFMSV